MLKTLIVDDEQASLNILGNLLTEFCPDLEVVGLADNIRSASSILNTSPVDVVFLDIQMPGGGGFELLSTIEDRQFQVVFVTGYERYAIQAIRLNALDYLLKPVMVSELLSTAERLRVTAQWISSTAGNTKSYHQTITRFLNHFETGNQPEFITFKDTHGFDVVRIKEILYMKGDRNYTCVFTESGRSLMTSKTLGYYESILPENVFVRTHKSFLINTRHVTRYHFDQSGYVLMSNGSKLDVSRRKYQELVACIERFSQA